jgi:hypothetical protein
VKEIGVAIVLTGERQYRIQNSSTNGSCAKHDYKLSPKRPRS